MSCPFALFDSFNPIAVVATDSAAAPHIAPRTQGFWFVEGQLVMTQGGPVTPHGGGPHAAPVMAHASSWYQLIDGGTDYACRMTDVATCCHPSTGRPWWIIT